MNIHRNEKKGGMEGKNAHIKLIKWLNTVWTE